MKTETTYGFDPCGLPRTQTGPRAELRQILEGMLITLGIECEKTLRTVAELVITRVKKKAQMLSLFISLVQRERVCWKCFYQDNTVLGRFLLASLNFSDHLISSKRV